MFVRSGKQRGRRGEGVTINAKDWECGREVTRQFLAEWKYGDLQEDTERTDQTQGDGGQSKI